MSDVLAYLSKVSEEGYTLASWTFQCSPGQRNEEDVRQIPLQLSHRMLDLEGLSPDLNLDMISSQYMGLCADAKSRIKSNIPSIATATL